MSPTDILLPILAIGLADAWCACGDCFYLMAIRCAYARLMRREGWARG